MTERTLKKLMQSLDFHSNECRPVAESKKRKRESEKMTEKGKTLLLEKNYSCALSTLNEALKLHPSNEEAKFYKAITYLDSDKP